MNKFINKNDKLIQENFKAIILYFDFFSPGVMLPRLYDYQINRKIIHIILRLTVILTYFFKLHRLLFNVIELKEEALIIIKGTGEWSSVIKVVERADGYKVIKLMSNRKKYLKEKKYYERYVGKFNKIHFPRYIFLEENILESDFIPLKTFHRLIAEGTISFDEAMYHFNKIRSEVKKVYGKKKNLIHGDLNVINIFLRPDNNYYFIDFTDSQRNFYQYDLYVLLYTLLFSFNLIEANEHTLKDYSYHNESVYILLETNKIGLEKIEGDFQFLRNKRYPNLN